MTVAAIVWTYDRFDVLQRALDAIRAQTRAPDLIVVVDNDSPDGTADRLAVADPSVVVHRMSDNAGVGAAAAAGMRVAVERGADWLWLVEDDTEYPPTALQAALDLSEVAADGSPLIVGWQGVVVRHGMLHHVEPGARPERVDAVLLDGSLVSRGVVDRVGYPRADYFMMIDDIEYSLRASRRGVEVVLTDAVRGRATRVTSQTSPTWRAYYQTRNHLRMARDLRSPSLATGAAVRLGRQLWLCATRGRASSAEAALRVRGAADALRGRMGRTVEPGTGSPAPDPAGRPLRVAMLMGDTPWMETWARAAEQSSEVVRIGFRPRDDDGPWLRRELGESVHYTIKVPPRTGPYRVVGRASDASLVLRFVRALREIERRHGRVDLLHAHFYANARWLPDMQRLVERPFVVTEHSTGWSGENPDNQISPRGRKIATRTYRHAAAVIAVSENLRSMMVAAGVPDDNLVVVPNPVDTTIFRPAAPCPPHEPRRLIAVSRLAEVKNFPVLFAALRQLVDAGVPFTIDVVGDGPARATVERDVASLPFGAARLLGSLPQEEVADHLRGADLFVTATRAENLPVAIIEALATGLPVVATDVNGVRELIDTDELGTLVPRDDPSALADAIRRAVGTTDDPTRRAARAQLAASRYSVQAVGIALATLYGTLRTPTDATTSASDAVRRHRETDPRAGRG